MSKDFSYSARSFLQNSASNPGYTILKCLLLGLFLGLTYFAFGLLRLFFTPVISSIIILILIYWMLVMACRAFTFPGGFWFWRRNVENYFQMAFVKKVQNSVTLLKNLIDYLLKEVAWNQYLSEEELVQIRMMISSVMNLFKNQEQHGTLSKRQKLLLDSFTEIGQLLSETDIINRADQRSFSMWSFLEENSEGQESLELPNALLYLRDRTEGHVLLDKCQKLEDRVNEITARKGLIGRLKRWIQEDSFGTINQVREEIGNRYECKQVSLQVDKKTTIDCVYIAGRNPDEANISVDRGEKKKSGSIEEADSNYYLQFASKGNKHLKATVIICCPNTSYYEFLYYESEWIDIYVRNGLNVFLWNYRGYGRSTGTASLSAIKKDGEFIVDYLRKEVGVKQLGVHGESVGGIVASHIAKTKNVDFLCVDRNFSNLGKLGVLIYGNLLGGLYKYITLQTEDACSDYLDTQCYKLIIFDAKDEAVPLRGSLKYDLTAKLLAHKLGVKEENNALPPEVVHPLSPYKIIRVLKKLIGFLKTDSYNKRIETKAQEYYELLNKEQMTALYWACSRISELFISLSSIQNLPSSRKSRRTQSITHFHTEEEAPPKPQKAGRRGSLDSSIINVSVLKEVDLGEEGQSHRKKTDESQMFTNESKILNETLDLRNLGQLDDAFLVKTLKRKSYANLFDEEAKANPDCVNLLVKVFATFEVLEAGGVQISDVMAVDSKHRLEVFKHFINSFEVWGSYQPLTKILEDEPKTLAYYHQHSLNKLKEFIKKIDYTIQKQKQKPIGRAQTKLVSAVLDDLEIISSVMPCLYQKLSIKFGSNASSPTGDSHLNMTGHDEVNIDVEHAKQTTDAEGRKFIALRSSTARETPGKLISAYLGSLLPVSGGHGGSLQQTEVEVYEFHLRNAKMIY